MKHAKWTLNKQIQAYIACSLITAKRVQISEREINFPYGHCKVKGVRAAYSKVRVKTMI
jgi:hypothetical protein